MTANNPLVVGGSGHADSRPSLLSESPATDGSWDKESDSPWSLSIMSTLINKFLPNPKTIAVSCPAAPHSLALIHLSLDCRLPFQVSIVSALSVFCCSHSVNLSSGGQVCALPPKKPRLSAITAQIRRR